MGKAGLSANRTTLNDLDYVFSLTEAEREKVKNALTEQVLGTPGLYELREQQAPGWVDKACKIRLKCLLDEAAVTLSVFRGREKTLRQIMDLTNHDAPAIYEPETIMKVNNIASTALGGDNCLYSKWPHNKPRDPHAPRAAVRMCTCGCDAPSDPRIDASSSAWYNRPPPPPRQTEPATAVEELVSLRNAWQGVREALACLSGDLNYDSVAKAKEILEKML